MDWSPNLSSDVLVDGASGLQQKRNAIPNVVRWLMNTSRNKPTIVVDPEFYRENGIIFGVIYIYINDQDLVHFVNYPRMGHRRRRPA